MEQAKDAAHLQLPIRSPQILPNQINVLRKDALVFEGGDVVVQLGEGHEGLMVIHSDLPSKHSSFFEALFSERWNNDKSTDGGSNQQIWQLELFFDRETRLGLLKKKNSSVTQRRMPPRFRASGNQSAVQEIASLRRWAQCETDQEMQSFLGQEWSTDKIQRHPRLQFMPNEVQPQLSYCAVYHLSSDESIYNNTNLGLRYRFHCTYQPYFHSYGRWMPLLEEDLATQAQFSEYSFDSITTFSQPTAKRALKYVRAMWKSLIAILYGKEIHNGYITTNLRRMRFVANIATLAQYYDLIEAVSPGLEKILMRSKSVWKFVAERPEFSLILAYHIRSVSLYIDAVKHVIGATLFPHPCLKLPQRNPPVFVLGVQTPWYSDDFKPPPEVMSFLLEARSSMLSELHALQQFMLIRLSKSISVFSSQSPMRRQFSQVRTGEPALRSDILRRVAELGLIAYVSGACICDGCAVVRHRMCSTLPHRLTVLFETATTKNVACLPDELFRDKWVTLFGLSKDDVAQKMLDIIAAPDFLAHLKYFCSTTDSWSCHKCREGSSVDAIYSDLACVFPDNSEYAPPQVCRTHFHKSRHFDSRKYSVLHSWNLASESDRSEYWPPSSDDYRPNKGRETLQEIETEIAKPSTLVALGLLDNLMLTVDAEALQRHKDRAIGDVDVLNTFDDGDDSIGALHDPSRWATTWRPSHLDFLTL